MNKKFLISIVAIFVLSMLLGLIIHGFLLKPEYTSLPNLFRSDEDAANYFPFMILGHVAMAVALSWIYRQGQKPGVSWIGQGIRFGLATALLMTVTFYMIYYAVQPMPGMLVVKQIVLDTIGMIIIGITLAFINKED